MQLVAPGPPCAILTLAGDHGEIEKTTPDQRLGIADFDHSPVSGIDLHHFVGIQLSQIRGKPIHVMSLYGVHESARRWTGSQGAGLLAVDLDLGTDAGEEF